MIDVGRFLTIDTYQYGRVVYEIIQNKLPCSVCGDNDMYELEVVTDNNFCLKDQEVVPFNNRVGCSLKQCGKSLTKELASNNDYRLQPTSQDDWRRNAILNES